MHLNSTAQQGTQLWYYMRLKFGTGFTPSVLLERAKGIFGNHNDKKKTHTLPMLFRQKGNESFSEFIFGFEISHA